MSWWQRVQDRAGWPDIKHSTRMLIVWFLILAIVGALLELFAKKLSGGEWFAIVIVSHFIARFIVGPEKKKDKEDDTC